MLPLDLHHYNEISGGINLAIGYKRVMFACGVGMLVALLIGLGTLLLGVEPMPGVMDFGLLCALVLAGTATVWANRTNKRARDDNR